MLLEEPEEEEGIIQCDPIGDPVFTDLEGNKFHTELFVNNIIIRLGNSVRVQLDEEDVFGNDTAYGQVLAIKHTKGDEVFVEVRWLLSPHQVEAKRKKILTEELLANELVESTQLDDIYAGSILELINLRGFDSKKAANQSQSSQSQSSQSNQSALPEEPYFVRRFMEISGSNSVQRVPHHSYFRRGMDCSDYEHAYESILDSYDGGSEGALLTDKFSVAIRKLHVSVIPDQLPCRSVERDEIQSFIREAIVSRETAKPIYICGMPGTGKTATVAATLKALLKEARDGLLPEFNAVEINCLRLHSPSDAYVQLWRHLTGEFVSATRAEKLLTHYFEGDTKPSRKKSSSSSSAAVSASAGASSSSSSSSNSGIDGNRKVTVCLVDELDFLMTRDESIVYNFFNWPLKAGSGMLLIGVSNVLDLPDRLSSKVTSRLANSIKKVTFLPYAYEQVREILVNRLGELEESIFEKKAVELLARKASNIAGDVRSALKICQRAIEIYLSQSSEGADESPSFPSSSAGASSSSASSSSEQVSTVSLGVGRVTKSMVMLAVNEYKESPLLKTISFACALDKVILASMCRHAKIMGTSDIAPDTLWIRFKDLMFDAKDDKAITLTKPPRSVFLEAIERLVDQGILVRRIPRSANALGPVMARKLATLSLRPVVFDVLAALKEDPIWNYVANNS